ncbi:MAG: hypothetical protein COB51_08470 [Moraxellaceae bacterium]|nr:MAG: hypothetical protein COB51_08470 [Moraxellaceae bacterium]
MKKLFLLFLLCSTNALSAPNPLGINEDSIAAMNRNMQQFQSCMKGIDQSTILSIQNQAQQLKMQIDALCSSGKLSEAQAQASTAKNILENNPSIQQMKKCSSEMSDFMPNGFTMAIKTNRDYSTSHVCELP